jgi:hypothetical protein
MFDFEELPESRNNFREVKRTLIFTIFLKKYLSKNICETE